MRCKTTRYENVILIPRPLSTRLEQIGRPRPQIDFRAEMREFIGMCIEHYVKSPQGFFYIRGVVKRSGLDTVWKSA